MNKLFSHLSVTPKKAAIFAAGVAVAAAMPLIFTSTFTRHVMIMIIIWSILGMGWNYIGGYAGQVSIGHSVFYGIGAYASAICFQFFGVTPWIGMWVGVAASLLTALGIGAPLLRLKGHYFAVATMAVAESCRIIFVNTPAVGGATGIDFLNKKVNPWYSMQFGDKLTYFYVFLAFAVVIALLGFYFDKSRFGYYLRTINGNEQAAESIGIDTAKYKLAAYLLSAGIVSIGGSLYAQYMLYIDPLMLMALKISLMICLVTVMGGIGKVLGPVVGAIVLTLISEYSRVLMGGAGNGIDQVIYGILVVIVVIYLPYGVLSLVGKKRKGKKTKAPAKGATVHE